MNMRLTGYAAAMAQIVAVLNELAKSEPPGRERALTMMRSLADVRETADEIERELASEMTRFTVYLTSDHLATTGMSGEWPSVKAWIDDQLERFRASPSSYGQTYVGITPERSDKNEP